MYFAFRILGCLFGTWESVFGITECLIYIMEYVFGVWEHLFGIWLGVFVLLYCKRTSLYFVFSLNICNLLWWKANLVWTSKMTKVFVDTGELKVVPKWGLVGFITSNADKCATGRKSGFNRSESKHNTAAKHN